MVCIELRFFNTKIFELTSKSSSKLGNFCRISFIGTLTEVINRNNTEQKIFFIKLMASQFIVTSYKEPINLAWTKVNFRLIQRVTAIDLCPIQNETRRSGKWNEENGTTSVKIVEFFTNYTKMPILAFLSLLRENKKKIQWQNVTPSGNRTRAPHSLWFHVQHYPFYTNLTFACKTETLGSLYSHDLLIPLKSM